MTTAEKIIIGLLVVLVVISIVAFAKPKDKVVIVDPGNGQPPIKCKENDPGYTVEGVLNSLCGTPICDPTRPGYNLDGFADIDCGFGRFQQRR